MLHRILFCTLLCFGATTARAEALLDTTFEPPAWTVGTRVSALALQADGGVLVGGYFLSADGSAQQGVQRLNAGGAADGGFAFATTDGDPIAIVVQGDGKFVVAPSNGGVRRFLADGRADPSFHAGLAEGNVKAIVEQPDGKLLVGGRWLRSAAGAPGASILRLNADGSIDGGFTGPLEGDNSYVDGVTGLALRSDGRVLVAGYFCFVSDSACNAPASLVRLDANGALQADLTALVENTARTVIQQPDGRVLVGGIAPGEQQRNLIRLLADDRLDTGFNPLPGGIVDAAFVQPDGKIMVAGMLPSSGGQSTWRVARLNADGSVDPSFDADGSGGANGTVYSLAAQLDGRVLIGGDFSSVGPGAVSRRGIARLRVPEAAVQQLSFGSGHDSVQWQRSGSGIEFGRVAFERSADGQTWAPLGEAAFNGGIWSLGGLSLPGNANVWLRARGMATTGSGAYVGFGGSVLAASRQLVATLTPSAQAGGSITPAVPQFVDTGTAATFTLTSDAGQQVLYVGGSCGGTLTGTVFTTASIAGDCTIEAHFAAASARVVTPIAGAGGTLAPSTPLPVAPGATQAFTVTANPGYSIAAVGGSCGGTLAGNVYTTAPVQANCTVEANFAASRYTISASAAGGHGTIAPATQTAAYGETATLTVMPDAGYNASVSGCGGRLIGNVYTTAPIAADCAITAAFAPIGASGVSLVVTAARDASNACTAQSTVLAMPGDYITFCYTYTNHSGRAIPWYYLQDSAGIAGPAPYTFPIFDSLPDGETRSVLTNTWVQRSTDVLATWVGLGDVPPHYVIDDAVPYDWVELAGSPSAVRLPLDTRRDFADVQVDVPFPFDFYGFPVDGKLCVSKNGAMRFSSGAPCALEAQDYFTHLVVSPAQPVFYGTPMSYYGGEVWYAAVGEAPHRRVIVEWSNLTRPYDNVTGAPITFQAILDEGGSTVTFQYLSMETGIQTTTNGAFAVAALTREASAWAGAPDNQAVYSANQPRLTAGKAVRFTPSTTPWRVQASAAAHIVVPAPLPTASPAVMDISVPHGGTATATLALGNDGNVAVTWTLGAQPGAATGARLQTPHQSMPRAAAREPALLRQADGAQRLAAAPRSAQTSASPSAPLLPSGTAHVPAYAIAFDSAHYGAPGLSNRYVSLDAANPAQWSVLPIGDISAAAVDIGFQLDNDFSRQYFLSNGFCNDDGCFEARYWYQMTGANETHRLGQGALLAPNVPDVGEESWSGVKWDHATHTLIGVAVNAGAGDSWQYGASCGTQPICRSDLFTIDPYTGASTWIAQIDAIDPDYGTAIADIAIAPNGDLIGLNMIDDTFYLIDRSSGHVRPIGPSGLNVGYFPPQSLDFDQTSGTLYYATWVAAGAPATMYTVDRSTGTATPVRPIGDGAHFLRALSIATPGGPCVDQADVPWLSYDVTGGQIEPGANASVNVAFNAGGLADGVYHAKLCVNTDAMLYRTLAVPVTFTVGAGDRIFGDGFDGAP